MNAVDVTGTNVRSHKALTWLKNEDVEENELVSLSADAWRSCVVYKNISHANGLDYANILLC